MKRRQLASGCPDNRWLHRRREAAKEDVMMLLIPIHRWLTGICRAVERWFDFRCDLIGLNFDDEDVRLDLASGRE